MDAAEADRKSVLNNDDAGATEVEDSQDRIYEANTLQEVISASAKVVTSDGNKGRSSRRKPNKTHRFVDSEEEEDGGDDGEQLEEYCDDVPYSGHSQNREDDNLEDCEEDEDNEEEGEMEEEEHEDTEDQHPPHLPDGTLVVQPVGVDDGTPARFHPQDIPYGRKTRTDVIPDHVMCTACEHRIPTNSIDHFYRHPVLKVLICRRCIAVYETKPIRMGDDGLDDACRWCAEGGDLICCDFCNNAFCKGCIERNLGRQELHSILNAGDDEKWHCYVCHPQLLAKHIESCNSIIASVEEREKVARRRQKSGVAKSPKQNQLMHAKSTSQMPSMPDTAALASAIASQVMSAGTGRRGVGRPRGRGSYHHGNAKGDILYIRTPSGGVVGIPAQSMDQLAEVSPLPSDLVEPQAKSRQSTRGSRSPRASSHRSTYANVPSLPMTSVTLSSTPPDINEYNVWSVLEKLLAATQSMGMLLGSLKDDLRRTGANLVAIEQLKKRREVAMKLWRAFVAYKKSFLDIEVFTRGGETHSSQTPQSATVVQQARIQSAMPKVAAVPKKDAAAENESDLLKDGSAGQKRSAAQEEIENSHKVKKMRLGSEPTVPQSSQQSTDVDDDEEEVKEEVERGAENDGNDNNELEEGTDSESLANKGNVFGAMHFEPLFDIKSIVKKE